MDLNEVLGTVTNLINTQADLHKQELEEVKRTGQNSSTRLEALEKMAKDVERLTNAYTDYQAESAELKQKNEELAAKQIEIETRLNRRKEEEQDPSKIVNIDPGSLLLKSEELDRFTKNRLYDMRGQAMKVELKGFSIDEYLYGRKDLVSHEQGVPLISVQRIQGVMMMPDIPLTVRAIIPTVPTTSNMVEYVRESVITNNAGPQWSTGGSGFIDGALKNKSDLDYTLESTPIKTIAHLMKASKQIFDDAPQLRGMVNTRLLYMLALEEELEILLGPGTNGKLLGIVPQAESYDTDLDQSNDTKIDKIRHAILQVALSKYMATNIVLNTQDWHDIELTKTNEGTTGNQGSYLLTHPSGQAPRRLWGLPVLESLNMPSGDFLVGNFRLGATIFDRQSASIQVATQNDRDFERNMVTILAEERLGLAVYRTDAFVEGSF